MTIEPVSTVAEPATAAAMMWRLRHQALHARVDQALAELVEIENAGDEDDEAGDVEQDDAAGQPRRREAVNPPERGRARVCGGRLGWRVLSSTSIRSGVSTPVTMLRVTPSGRGRFRLP